MVKTNEDVIVFDAMCVLCSAYAQFILNNDRVGRFRLASSQSKAGADLCRHAGVSADNPESLFVINEGRVLRNSDAIIFIYANLTPALRIIGGLKFIPKAIRDPIYLFIARNRYRLFGKRENCWLPKPEQAGRLL